MNDTIWAKSISEKIKKKMEVVASRSKGIIPYTTVNGRFDDWTERNICWWTNGFWGGIMWQLYNATKLPIYRELAIDTEEKLDKNLMMYGGLDHDNGFKWLPTSYARYSLEKNEASRNRCLLAASHLLGRFNPAGSMMAVEGITSPDGRVLGRMGHAERAADGLYRNVPGTYSTSMFENAVKYFR